MEDALPGRASPHRLQAKAKEKEAYRLYQLQFVVPVVIFVVVSALTTYVTTWTGWTLDGLNFGANQVAAPDQPSECLLKHSLGWYLSPS